MKAALVIGIVLVVLGVGGLGYFASPVRFLLMAYVPHPIDLRIPIMGGLSLALGITLLFVSRKVKWKPSSGSSMGAAGRGDMKHDD
jgi:hypothetical protein